MPWSPAPTDVYLGPVPGWWVEPPEPPEVSGTGWYAPVPTNITAPALIEPVATAEVEATTDAHATAPIVATATVATTTEASAELTGEGSVFTTSVMVFADATVVIDATPEIATPDALAGLPYTFPYVFGDTGDTGYPYTLPFRFGGNAVPIRQRMAAPALVSITATASASAVLEAPAAVSIISFGLTASFPYDLPMTLS